LIEAMVKVKPRPLQSGLLVKVAPGSKFEGRRGVLRKEVSDLVREVELWPKDGGIPTGPQQTDMQEIPVKDLLATEPRIPCPFGDMTIKRITSLLWAHVWRLHKDLTPELHDELQQLLLGSVKVGRAMVSIGAQAMGERSGNVEVVHRLLNTRKSLVQALELDANPLLQIPHVTKSLLSAGGAPWPTLKEVVDLESDAFAQLVKRLKFTDEQRLDAEAFCRHVPRLQVSAEVEVPDEKDVSESDFACLQVTIKRKNLAEGEASGPVHAPFFPGPKFEELWVLVYDDRARRLITADCVLGNGHSETCKVRFMVPRAGEFSWSVRVVCDSYLGLDVACDVPFRALKRKEVNREIFIHPADMHIKSLFEELMEGLQPPEEESESEEEDDAPPKPVAKAKAKAAPGPEAAEQALAKPAKVEDSDDDSDGEQMPDGVFHKIKSEPGKLFRQPQDGDENQDEPFAQLPQDTYVRGFEGDGRPEGWIELAPGGAWLRTGGERTEALGALLDQSLRVVVQTTTPVNMVKRWMKGTSHEIGFEDLVQVQEIAESRVRMRVEELARDKLGDETFNKYLDEAQAQQASKRARLGKALGIFQSANACLWQITPAGQVRGLHPDGSRIRDKIETGPSEPWKSEDCVRIGPFKLDERRTCSCIHWMRQEDPTGDKAWVWQKDNSLQTRVQLGSAFPGV